MRIVVWSLVVLACLSADAGAQTLEARGTAAGIFGAGRTWDDEGGLGTGPAIGAGLDVGVNSALTSLIALAQLLGETAAVCGASWPAHTRRPARSVALRSTPSR
jgi:hypothetical protein